MKKILLSTYACSPIRGSEPGSGWSWATEIAKLGYEVWCYTNIEDRKETEEAAAKLNLPNLHFVFISLPYGLDKKWLNPSSKTIYFHYFLWQRVAAKAAKKQHQATPFDVGHHVTYGSLQQGNFLWKINGLKVIFGPVGGGQKALPQLKSYFGKAWRTEIIRNVISNWTTKFNRNFKNSVKKSAAVLVTNQDTFDMAAKAVKGVANNIFWMNDSAVPYSMQNNPKVIRIRTKELKLLWVGRLLPRKGINLVLESLGKLSANIDYSLTIVGGGEQFSKIDGWIDEFKIDRSRLNILGQIPFSQVIDEYKKADVFVFCSLRDSFGAQFAEAMSFGLPIVALNIHGAAIGVPDNCGIKVNVTTKEDTLLAIAAAIEKMHNDPDFREDCGKNGHDFSKDNTWAKRAKEATSKYY